MKIMTIATNGESAGRVIQLIAGTSILVLLTVGAGVFPTAAWGHGERMHSPSLRMRSIQWYDVRWSKHGEIKVGDTVTITGKMYFPSDRYWPENVKAPDPAYLQTAGPASVFVKREAYINETPMPKSVALELGRTYEFKLVMQARVPGRWHLHPALQITGTGPVVGPGEFFEVQGALSGFVWSAEAGRGGRIKIDNLESWQLGNIAGWHIFWIAVALVWLGWWFRRPLLIPRFRALREGHEELLVTRRDVIAGVALLAGTLVVVIGSYIWTESKYPETIPLQTGKTPVAPLPEPPSAATTRVVDAEFDVPARMLRMTLRVSNDGDRPLWVGQYATAGIRFIRSAEELPSGPAEALKVNQKGYPENYLREALVVRPEGAIPPGETRDITIEVADAVWEVEGLAQIVRSPVRRFGGLVWLYDDSGRRVRQHVDFPVDVTYGST